MNIDFLLKAFFNALGLDPEAMRTQLFGLQQWLVDSIKKFDGRLHVLESNHAAAREEMAAISQKLDVLIQHFGVNANGNERTAIEYNPDDGRLEH